MFIRQKLVSPDNYKNKCPHPMEAKMIIVHNTANNASANNEINYMISNTNQVSFHIAVDDIEAVQGIPFERNTWNAGDGAEGYGNRNGLSIEICYSKLDSDIERFKKAERNTAILIAQLLTERGWDISNVTKHQDYNNKYCPHRTLDMGWERFLNMIREELGNSPVDPPSDPEQRQGVHMVLTGSAARIRADVVNGTILTTVPNGSIFEVIGLYSWKASDGFYWGWAKYNDIEGYFQYDPSVMHLFGIVTTIGFKMILASTSVTMKSSIMGTDLITIPKDSELLLSEFISKRAADGFYWCKGIFNNITGFFYYNPATMIATTDGVVPPVNPNPEENVKMQLIRTEINLLSEPVIGTNQILVPNGSMFDLLNLSEKIESDGYRWGIGKYNGIEGYFQNDSYLMHPVGISNGKHCIKNFGVEVSLKVEIMGNELLVITKNNTIKVIEFLSELQSDGFYWCKGEYEGKVGYMKYNPYYMYVISTSNPPIDPEPAQELAMKVIKTGANLRTDVVTGTVKTTVPIGSFIEIVGLYSWKASDGYRWGWGKFNGIEGAFQYDSECMHPVGKTNSDRFKMILAESGVYLRDAILGNKLTLAAKGSSLVIFEFIENIANDGYYWCKTEYNGVSAYFQYDPKLMYPTND